MQTNIVSQKPRDARDVNSNSTSTSELRPWKQRKLGSKQKIKNFIKEVN